MATLRKIELQEPDDLTYLINNVRAAALERLNEAFPPVDGHDGSEDELRIMIEKEVCEYINRTFRLALPNLAINGMPVSPGQFLPPATEPSFCNTSTRSATVAAASKATSNGRLAGPVSSLSLEPIVQFEPFDDRARARVEALCREEEDLLREIAALKRRVPGAVATRWRDNAAERLQRDDAALAQLVEGATTTKKALPSQDRAGEFEPLVLPQLPRHHAVEATFASAVRDLSRLSKNMPTTIAKVDGAKAAGEYVVRSAGAK